MGIRSGAVPDSQNTNQANGRLAAKLNDPLDVQPSASTSRAASTMPQPQPVLTARVTDYLVGPQLDDALSAGQDLVVSWPFADGEISDWTQAEALW